MNPKTGAAPGRFPVHDPGDSKANGYVPPERRNIMKRVLVALILCLALLCSLAQAAEQESYAGYLPFCYEASSTLKFVDLENCQIRAVYEITLPQEGAVDQLILDEYSGYAHVYLMEVGYSVMPPILLSEFVCVGVAEDGQMASLTTPSTLVARTFDLNMFDPVTIERVF